MTLDLLGAMADDGEVASYCSAVLERVAEDAQRKMWEALARNDLET